MKKPWIGITSSLEDVRKYRVTRHYADWILAKGGVPVHLPYVQEITVLREYAMQLDGLLLSGGGDIDPTLFGSEPLPGLGSITPERDAFELQTTEEFLKLDKPILAICRGAQILNIAAGGTMYQDLAREFPGDILQHDQQAPIWHASHTIDIDKDSKLYEILQLSSAKTNSFHHQAIDQPAPHFVVSARSKDGVVEAIHSNLHSYVVGVQWHPECMPDCDIVSEKLFSSFIEACQKLNRAVD